MVAGFRCSNFLCCIDNRIGCLIIATFEFIWEGINFYLFTIVGLKAVREYVMRISYYRNLKEDVRKLIL